MNVTSIVFLVLGLVCLTWFCYERTSTGPSTSATNIKALTSVCFIAIAAASFIVKDAPASAAALAAVSKFRFMVTVGLLFGLLGDIWLDLKFVFKDEKQVADVTFAGFVTFAIQHFFVITAFMLYFADYSTTKGVLICVLPIVAGLAAGILNVLFLEKPMKLNYGRYKLISGVYGGILIGNTLLSGVLAISAGFKNVTLDMIFIGLVFFLISDLILSGTYFGEGKNRPVDVITNHVTYYIGQFIIAMSLLFLA